MTQVKEAKTFAPSDTLGHSVRQRVEQRLIELHLDGPDLPVLAPLNQGEVPGVQTDLEVAKENQKFYLEMEEMDAVADRKPWHQFPKWAKRYGEPVFITPPMAETVLSGYNISNRRKVKKDIEKYARDMLAGNWFDTGESIQIDIHGNLVDGQHRLAAVILAMQLAEQLGLKFDGCPLFVVWNVPPAARLVVDSGKKRPETYKVELLHGSEEHLGNSTKLFALCRAMMLGLHERNSMVYSHSELGYFSQKYAKEIAWVVKNLRGITRADVLAATCKAYIWYGEDKMMPFCDKLRNIVFASKNDPVGQLYKYIHRNNKSPGIEVYRKTLAAIDHYLNGREINRLRELDQDIFEWIGTWDIPPKQ